MEHYLKTQVTAPDWMREFHCIEGACPHTCCQKWNIEVDPAHGEMFAAMEDPVMQKLLLKGHLRRKGSRQTEEIYRLQLLKSPDERCPMMNSEGKCRLQLSRGAYALCDTCYFFPRVFWSTDSAYTMTASLACPEAARLALCHREPTGIIRMEAEIDPAAEWLETEMIPDPEVRELLTRRDEIIRETIAMLQAPSEDLPVRICRAACFLAGEEFTGLPEKADPSGTFSLILRTFDRGCEGLEKPFASVHDDVMQLLAGGLSPAERLAETCRQTLERTYLPFIGENPFLEENFLVHTVFSDSFKQFGMYLTSDVKVREIRRFEGLYLLYSYALLRMEQALGILQRGGIDTDGFLRTVWEADRKYWHYPAWFHRCITNTDPERDFHEMAQILLSV